VLRKGDTLETYGAGNFTFGYFGGIMDAATGLLYVGNGQYYDPATGRFLTRDAKPNNSNPYVPWDPTVVLLGPLGLLALVYGRKKKGSKVGMLLVLLLVGASVGMTLAACGNETQEFTAVVTPDGTATITFGDDTVVVDVTPSPGGPSTPLTIPCPTPDTPPQLTPTPELEELLDIYTLAGLYTQSPFLKNTRWRGPVYAAAPLWDKDPYYVGIGVAKVTDAQMERPEGDQIPNDGIGLGLRTEHCDSTCPSGVLDQDDYEVAYLAMKTRISLRVKKCINNGCTATDAFIVAALAENESITPKQVQTAINQYRQNDPSKGVIINWKDWLPNADPDHLDYNLKLIRTFYSHTGDIPGVDPDYIEDILKKK
jgi:hypothetical protein